MPVGLSLILVVFFLFMNAFFVVAEFALVRVRKSQLQIAEEEGRSGAKAALRVANNVNAYLSACQLGICLLYTSLPEGSGFRKTRGCAVRVLWEKVDGGGSGSGGRIPENTDLRDSLQYGGGERNPAGGKARSGDRGRKND